MNTCCVCEAASAMLVRKNNMYNEYISLVLAKNPSPHLAEKMLTSPKTLCWKFQILSRFSLLDRVLTVAQSIWTLRLYSHLPCLVWLNQTEVRFPSWCGSFGQVWMQQSHSGADQGTVPKPSWRGGLGLLPNKLWSGWMDKPMNGWP